MARVKYYFFMAFMWLIAGSINLAHAIRHLQFGRVAVESCNRCGREKKDWKYCKRCGNPALRQQRVVVRHAIKKRP